MVIKIVAILLVSLLTQAKNVQEQVRDSDLKQFLGAVNGLVDGIGEGFYDDPMYSEKNQ